MHIEYSTWISSIGFIHWSKLKNVFFFFLISFFVLCFLRKIDMKFLVFMRAPLLTELCRYSGASSAWVRWVWLNPTILREGFSNPWLFEEIQYKHIFWHWMALKLANLQSPKSFRTHQYRFTMRPLVFRGSISFT